MGSSSRVRGVVRLCVVVLLVVGLGVVLIHHRAEDSAASAWHIGRPTRVVDTSSAGLTRGQQGLATDGERLYVAYDVGGGFARIATYDLQGRVLGVSPELEVGHAAEVAWRRATDTLYVANGGLRHGTTSEPTKIYEVTLDAKHVAESVSRLIDFAQIGYNGMVAVDNDDDSLVVIGGPDGGPFLIEHADFDGHVKRTAVVHEDGVLQGIETVKDAVWLYVTVPGSGRSGASRIDTFGATGRPGKSTGFVLPGGGEAEGMAMSPNGAGLFVGATSTPRVMSVPVAWS